VTGGVGGCAGSQGGEEGEGKGMGMGPGVDHGQGTRDWMSVPAAWAVHSLL